MKKHSTHKRLIEIQKGIYQTLEAEVHELLGETPASIRKYQREWRKDFPRDPKRLVAISKKELIRQIRSTDVTLIADFHTFAQAQRTALRLIRESRHRGESWFFGLEMIPSHFQKELDEFQKGKISLEKFFEKIRYNEEWGFPWENYAPIFDWARKNKVRLIALNQPKLVKKTLHPEQSTDRILAYRLDQEDLYDRDRWAAGIITDLFMSEQQRMGKRPRMIALYGELHVGSRHLPAQLKKISKVFFKKPLRSISIHQNDDSLYWKLAKREKEIETSALRLKKDVFCAISSSPWAKLQSLVEWAEGAEESETTDHFSSLTDACHAIARFLEVDPPPLDTLTIRTVKETDFADSLRKRTMLRSDELGVIRHHITYNLPIYIPQIDTAYLGTPSSNRTAEIASIYLLRKKTGLRHLFNLELDDFFRLALESAFGFLGSLILNPKRKCDFTEDHILRMKMIRNGERERFLYETEARELVVSISFGKFKPLQDLLRKRSPKSTATLMLAARFLGQSLGKKLHLSLLSDKVTLSTARRLCLGIGPKNRTSYETRYTELSALLGHDHLFSNKNDWI